MDKTNKLRERGFFITLLNNFTKAIASTSADFLASLNSKIFRVRIENEKYFVNALDKTAQAMEKAGNSIKELKLAENLDKVDVDLIHSINSTTTQSINIDKIETFDIKGLGQKEVTEKLSELQATLSASIKELSTVMSSVAKKDIKIPAMPKSMAIDGEVGIDSLPDRLYSSFNELKTQLQAVEKGINGIKLDVPTPKDIVFPKEMSISNLKALQDDIKELKKAIESMPSSMPIVEFPSSINVGNFPPQKIPQPVTNFNLNPLRGVVEDTQMLVDFPVPLPAVPLENRRSIIIFNNSTTDTLYIGNNATAPGTGLPILPQTYSPVIDAGVQMTIYGSTTGAKVDTRILEISNDAVGG